MSLPASAAARAGRCASEFSRAQLPRKVVEHGIDHAGLLRVDEGASDIDVFATSPPAPARRARQRKLVGAGAQYRAQHRLDALERPTARQRGVDLRIERALLADDAM